MQNYCFFLLEQKKLGIKFWGLQIKFLEGEKKICIFATNILYIKIITTFALNNLWTYIQGLYQTQG